MSKKQNINELIKCCINNINNYSRQLESARNGIIRERKRLLKLQQKKQQQQDLHSLLNNKNTDKL